MEVRAHLYLVNIAFYTVVFPFYTVVFPFLYRRFPVLYRRFPVSIPSFSRFYTVVFPFYTVVFPFNLYCMSTSRFTPCWTPHYIQNIVTSGGLTSCLTETEAAE